MLKLLEQYNSIRALCLDPGLNNVGTSLWDIAIQPTVSISSISALTLKSERLVDDSFLDDEDVTERLIKRHKMANALRRILESFDPHVVAIESPFFDRRKPGSFQVLAEVMSTIYDTIVAYNPSIRIYLVPPQLAKKYIGVAGQKGKEVVKDGILKLTDVLQALQDPLDTLDEHAIDSLAIGYCWLMDKSGLDYKGVTQ